MDKELAQLQGQWQLLLKVNGQEIRNVKKIEGNHETVMRYDVNTDRLIDKHEATIELSTSGDVNVLTFRSEAASPAPALSYVYKIDGRYLVEITGILTEARYKNNVQTPRLFRWERIDLKGN